MDDKYRGMTVNERLYVAGLLNSFDKAIQDKDVDLVISVLRQVELTGSNIDDIIKYHRLK